MKVCIAQSSNLQYLLNNEIETRATKDNGYTQPTLWGYENLQGSQKVER